MNTSATGGYLLPYNAPAPLEGQDLFRFLQQIFVNITGMPGTSFFPRWQFPDVANLPVGNWAAFGVTKRSNPKFAFIKHVPATGNIPEHDEFQTHETLEILVSFYSPDGTADYYAALLRDGLYIPQNLAILNTQNASLVDTGDLRTVPSLTKERWLYRVDLPVRIRRQIVRWYAILDLVAANVTVNNESYTTTIVVLQPDGDASINESSDIVHAVASVFGPPIGMMSVIEKFDTVSATATHT
jgi:hypothetical protein